LAGQDDQQSEEVKGKGDDEASRTQTHPSLTPLSLRGQVIGNNSDEPTPFSFLFFYILPYSSAEQDGVALNVASNYIESANIHR
jgi:hypothetical protein